MRGGVFDGMLVAEVSLDKGDLVLALKKDSVLKSLHDLPLF